MPYQLGLPDGSYLDVDDSVSMERARDLAIQKFPDLFPDRDVGFMERVGTRIKENVLETPELARAAGAVAGFNDYTPEKKTSPVPQRRLREFFQHPIDVTGELVGGGIGSMLPSLAGMGAGAATGAAIGSFLGPGGTAAGAGIGALVGGVGSALTLNTGDIYQGLLEEGVSPEQARPLAALVTIPVSALDVASLGLASRLLPGVRGAVSKVVGRSIAKEEGLNLTEDQLRLSGERYIQHKFGSSLERHPILTAGGFEAGTESLQQAMQEGANAYGSGKPFLTADRMESIATAGLMGGIGGGMLGGVGSMMPSFPAVTTEDRERAKREGDLPLFGNQDLEELRRLQLSREQQIPDLVGRANPAVGLPPLLPAPQATEEVSDGLPQSRDEVAKAVEHPLGLLAADEVLPAVAERLNMNRAIRGEEPLNAWSIPEMQAAGATREEVERAIGIRTNFNPKKKVEPASIIKAAQAKNLVTSDEGFKDFLLRTAGYPDLSTMSPTQRQASLAAINKLPRFPVLTSLPVLTRQAEAPGAEQQQQQQPAGVWLPGTTGDLHVTSTKTGGKDGYSVYQVTQEEGKPRKRALLASFPTQDMALSDAVARADPEALTDLSRRDVDARSPDQADLGVTPGVSQADRIIAQRARERLGEEPTGGVTSIEAPQGEAQAAAERIKALPPKMDVVGAKPISPELHRKLQLLDKALTGRLSSIVGRTVNLDIVGTMQRTITDAKGKEHTIHPNASYLNNVITIAMEAKGGYLRALNHESIHALREMGALNGAEWEILKKKIDSEKWLDRPFGTFKSSVRQRYASQGLTGDALYEEAMADMFAAHASGDLHYPGIFTSLARRLNNFFEAIKNAFRGMGFVTGDDIFERIDRGEYANRGSGTTATTGVEKFSTTDFNPKTIEDAEQQATHIINVEPESVGAARHPVIYYHEPTARAFWAWNDHTDFDSSDNSRVFFVDRATVADIINAPDVYPYHLSSEKADSITINRKKFAISREPKPGLYAAWYDGGGSSAQGRKWSWFSEPLKSVEAGGAAQKQIKFSLADAERDATHVFTSQKEGRTFAILGYYNAATKSLLGWRRDNSRELEYDYPRQVRFLPKAQADMMFNVAHGRPKATFEGNTIISGERDAGRYETHDEPMKGDTPVVMNEGNISRLPAIADPGARQKAIKFSQGDSATSPTEKYSVSDAEGERLKANATHEIMDGENASFYYNAADRSGYYQYRASSGNFTTPKVAFVDAAEKQRLADNRLPLNEVPRTPDHETPTPGRYIIHADISGQPVWQNFSSLTIKEVRPRQKQIQFSVPDMDRTPFKAQRHETFVRELHRIVGDIQSGGQRGAQGKTNLISLGRTPVVLRQIIVENQKPFKNGKGNLDVVLGSGSTIYLKGTDIHTGSAHGEAIPMGVLDQLPQLIADPLAVFASTGGMNEKGFRVLTKAETPHGRPVVVGIEPQVKIQEAGGAPAHFALTVFPSDNWANVRRWADAGLLRYYDDQHPGIAAATHQTDDDRVPGRDDSLSVSGEPWVSLVNGASTAREKDFTVISKSFIERRLPKEAYSLADDIENIRRRYEDHPERLKLLDDAVFVAKNRTGSIIFAQSNGLSSRFAESYEMVFNDRKIDYIPKQRDLSNRQLRDVFDGQGTIDGNVVSNPELGRRLEVRQGIPEIGDTPLLFHRNSNEVSMAWGEISEVIPRQKQIQFSQADEIAGSTHIINPDSSAYGKNFYDAESKTVTHMTSASGWGRRARYAQQHAFFVPAASTDDYLNSLINTSHSHGGFYAGEGHREIINGDDGSFRLRVNDKSYPLRHGGDPMVGDILVASSRSDSAGYIDYFKRVTGIKITPNGKGAGYRPNLQRSINFSLGEEESFEPHPKGVTPEEAAEEFRNVEAEARYSLPDQPWYYSELAKQLTEWGEKAASPTKWLGIIKNNFPQKGVKKDEIRWSGIEDWLKIAEAGTKDRPGYMVQKEDLLRFLAENGVRLNETHLGEPAKPPRVYDDLPEGYALEERIVKLPPKKGIEELSAEFERFLAEGDTDAVVKKLQRKENYETEIKPVLVKTQQQFFKFVWPVTKKGNPEQFNVEPDPMPMVKWVRENWPDKDFFPEAKVKAAFKGRKKKEWVVWQHTAPVSNERTWTEEEDRRLLSEYDRGMGYAEIAGMHERSQRSVVTRLNRYGRVGEVPDNLPTEPTTTEGKKEIFTRSDDSGEDAKKVALGVLNEAEKRKSAESVKRPQYKQYQQHEGNVQGGEQPYYRELLMQLPQIEDVQATRTRVEKEDFKVARREGFGIPIYDVFNKDGERVSSMGNPGAALDIIEELVSRGQNRFYNARNFNESHYDTELKQNLVFWTRVNGRTDAEGRKVLFMEELQSDWAQKFRKTRYTKTDVKLRAKIGENEYAFTTGDGVFSGIGKTPEEAQANVVELLQSIGSKRKPGNMLAEGPFITTTDSWVSLALKKVTRWAIDNGFERVSWITGQQSGLRWGGEINRTQGFIAFYDNIMPMVADKVIPKLGGAKVTRTKIAGTYDTAGKFTFAVHSVGVGANKKYFIREARSSSTLKNDDGTDVLYFKDESEAQATLAELNKDFSYTEGQPGFDITPELKERVLKGLPLFSMADQLPTAERSAVGRSVSYSMLDLARGIDEYIKPYGKLDQLRTVFQDKMLPVKRLQEEIGKRGGSITEAMDSYLREELFHGRVGDRIGNNEKNLYKPLIEGLRKSRVELGDFEDWLYARHAPERNAYLAKVMGVSDGSGMSDIEAAKALQDVEARYGKTMLEDFGIRFDAIIADTNRVRQGGFLTDVYDPASGFKHYAPLRSFEEDPDEKPNIPAWRRTGLLADVRGREDPKLKGRRTLASNLLAAAIMQNEMAVIRAEKNMVGRAFLDMVRANQDKMPGVSIIETNTNPSTWTVDADGVIRVRQNSYYYDPSTLIVKEPNPAEPGKIQETAIKIDDQRVADAIKGVNPQSSEVGGFIVRQFGRLNRWLSLVNTGLNPEFLVSNLIKDLQTAGIVIQGTDYKGTAAKLVAQIPMAVKGVWKSIRNDPSADSDPWSQAFKEMQAAGGRTYFLGIKDVGDKMREIQKLMDQVKEGNALSVKNAIGSVERFVEDINQVFENATRLSAYKIARDSGASTEKAASLAKNITVNFTRGGQVKTLMNSLYLFYNASLQGSFVVMGAMKSPLVRKIVAGVVIGGMLMDVLNRAVSDDDDDGENAYDKIMRAKPYVGEHFMVMMIPGSKKYMALPMPYGFNAFYNLGRNLSATLAGKAKPLDAAKSILFTGVDAFNPLGGTENFLTFVAPTVADPFVELATNRNFAGQKIVPDASPYSPYKKPDSQLYWSNTAVPYVKVAEWMNKLTGGSTAIPGLVDVSPETMEYWIEYAGGATAKFVERSARLGYAGLSGDLEKVEVGQIPFLRKAVGSLDKRANAESYYDRAAKVLEARAELQAAVADHDQARVRAALQERGPELSISDFFARTDKRIADLRTQKKKIANDERIPADYKKTLLDRLDTNMDMVLTSANRLYLNAVEKRTPAAGSR